MERFTYIDPDNTQEFSLEIDGDRIGFIVEGGLNVAHMKLSLEGARKIRDELTKMIKDIEESRRIYDN